MRRPNFLVVLFLTPLLAAQDPDYQLSATTDAAEVVLFNHVVVGIQAGPGKRWGSHGDGISLYVYDPDDNVVELRHY